MIFWYGIEAEYEEMERYENKGYQYLYCGIYAFGCGCG